MTDADDTDDLALLANTPAQAESQQQYLEQTSVGIGLSLNANKMEFVCFKPEGAVSPLKC